MASTAARPRPAARAPGDATGVVLAVVGAALVLPGLLAFFSPGEFYAQIAGYPPRNDHFLRDLGAFQIGLGAVALLAWLRPAMRAPVLAILALHYALHTVSHVVDLGDSDPAWQGPAALAVQALATAVLAALAVRELRA
jgi:uncharacterized protein YjeT (DUF2065 family)